MPSSCYTKMFAKAFFCRIAVEGRGMTVCRDSPKYRVLSQVDEDGNIIDSCFKTFGCGSAIASSSVATEW